MNLSLLVAQSARRMPDKPALIVGPRVCTYRQLEAATQRTTDTLLEAGVRTGRKIAITVPNGPEFVAGLMGILRAGAIAVPCPLDMQAPERASMLELVRCEYQMGAGKLNVADEMSFKNLDDAAARHLYLSPTPYLRSDPIDQRLLDTGASNIRFTSGTTSAFKGVVLSHQGIRDRFEIANRALQISGDDTIFFGLPMAHHFAVSVMLHLSVGATIVTGSVFLGDSVAREVHRHRATIIYGTPVSYRLMADAPHVDTKSLRSVRLAISTAMALPGHVATSFQQRFEVPLAQALGIIEVGMPIMNLPHPQRILGALGRLIDGFEARVVGDNGRDCPTDEPGELWLRGPGMLAAYYAPWRSQPEILHDGWFRTGDVVRCDEAGNYFLMGRTKDVINVGGTKVFPIEIEEVLASHEAVGEALVTGIPHDVLGEIPVASVELREACRTTPEALIEHCRRHVSPVKVPRVIRIVDALPRTHSGKVARAANSHDTVKQCPQ